MFGSICVGLVPALASDLLRGGFAVSSLLFWRYLIGLSLMLPLVVATGAARAASPAWALKVAGFAAVFSTAQTLLFFNALRLLPSGVVMLIFYTFPAVTAALELFLTGRPPSRITFLAITAVLCGAALAASASFQHGDVTAAGLAWALPGPLLYGLYLATSARLLHGRPPMLSASLLYAGLVSAYGAMVLIGGLQIPAAAEGWLRLVALGTLGGVIYTTLFSYGLPRLGANRYGVIASLELATVVIVGWLVLGEALTMLQGVGAALVMIGVIVQSVERGR